MSNFSSMITSTAVVPPLPTLVHKVTQEITVEAKRLGLSAVAQLHTGTQLSGDLNPEYFCIISFAIDTPLSKKEANVQISYSGWNPEASARILKASGFPDQLQHFVHNLSTNASSGGVSSGVPSVKENDPPQAKRGKRVAAEAKAPSTFAVAINALIDIHTLKMEEMSREKPRAYIGASGIANECEAYHALCLRGFPSDTPSPQLIRIFNEGHRVETYVVDLLRKCGHNVEEIDPGTGKQWRYVSNTYPSIMCNLDGYITPAGSTERMTLEVKSMNRDKFKAFKEKGLALSHPQYMVQVQLGMALTIGNSAEFSSKCFFIAYCKDNQQFHVEVIDYEPYHASTAEAVSRVARHVLPDSGNSAARVGAHENEYDCSQCFKRSSCWKPQEIVTESERTCLQCSHASLDLSNDGKWVCMAHKKRVDQNSKVCEKFQMFRIKRQ